MKRRVLRFSIPFLALLVLFASVSAAVASTEEEVASSTNDAATNSADDMGPLKATIVSCTGMCLRKHPSLDGFLSEEAETYKGVTVEYETSIRTVDITIYRGTKLIHEEDLTKIPIVDVVDLFHKYKFEKITAEELAKNEEERVAAEKAASELRQKRYKEQRAKYLAMVAEQERKEAEEKSSQEREAEQRATQEHEEHQRQMATDL